MKINFIKITESTARLMQKVYMAAARKYFGSFVALA
jgi:hypothetical protein